MGQRSPAKATRALAVVGHIAFGSAALERDGAHRHALGSKEKISYLTGWTRLHEELGPAAMVSIIESSFALKNDPIPQITNYKNK